MQLALGLLDRGHVLETMVVAGAVALEVPDGPRAASRGRSTLPTPPGPLPGQGRATEVVADLSADRFHLYLLGQNGKVSLIGYESTSFRENPKLCIFIRVAT
jgi:hypothetical protein